MMEDPSIRTGGIESRLAAIAWGCLIAGIITGLFCVIASQARENKDTILSSIYLILAFASVGEAIVLWTLFQAGGEIIRLLKKQNGLPYGGSISKTEGFGNSFFCSQCGAPSGPIDQFCNQCGSNMGNEMTGTPHSKQ